MKKQRCQSGGCVKAMNIQYHVFTDAAHIESLDELRQEHDLRNIAFIQIHVNKLADT